MDFANQTVNHGGDTVTETGDRLWYKAMDWREEQRNMINEVYYNYVRSIERFAYDFNATEHDQIYVDQIKTLLDEVQEHWEKYQEKDTDARSQSIKNDLVNYMKGTFTKNENSNLMLNFKN